MDNNENFKRVKYSNWWIGANRFSSSYYYNIFHQNLASLLWLTMMTTIKGTKNIQMLGNIVLYDIHFTGFVLYMLSVCVLFACDFVRKECFVDV